MACTITRLPCTRKPENCLPTLEIEDEARWNAIAQTPACRRWWEHMADLMQVNPDRSPRATELQEVFHLD